MVARIYNSGRPNKDFTGGWERSSGSKSRTNRLRPENILCILHRETGCPEARRGKARRQLLYPGKGVAVQALECTPTKDVCRPRQALIDFVLTAKSTEAFAYRKHHVMKLEYLIYFLLFLRLLYHHHFVCLFLPHIIFGSCSSFISLFI